MKYEAALKEAGYAIPTNPVDIIKKADLAKHTLKSIRLGLIDTTTKSKHALRRIMEEADRVNDDDYQMPELMSFGANTESIVALKERYKEALEKFDQFADDHFEIDPNNITKLEIDRLVDLLFRIEKYVS